MAMASSNGSMMSVRNVEEDDAPTALTTSGLEHKMKQLREQSNHYSQLLTQKLASSQSGQNLLHIGTSLSSLPPDLHSLVSQLHPVLSAAEDSEQEQLQALQSLVQHAQSIRFAERRRQHALQAAELYADLCAAEQAVKGNGDDLVDDTSDSHSNHYAASLERAAHVYLCLSQDLQHATANVTNLTASPKFARQASLTNDRDSSSSSSSSAANNLVSIRTLLPDDTEHDQFLLQLAPRIRRLESDVAQALTQQLQSLLEVLKTSRLENGDGEHISGHYSTPGGLRPFGHVLRGLVLLNRGKEAEHVFMRVAVLPLLRSNLVMGRLDQGGARGACAGLPSLLDELGDEISQLYGPLLCYTEAMVKGVNDDQPQQKRPVDLLTNGVWVPIVTALMGDAGLQMAIFSPGIASILQANYVVLDAFLTTLASRLLQTSHAEGLSADVTINDYQPTLDAAHILAAQDRIYAHPKTADFTKKWNLPIYYQLRFGECCARLNQAIAHTQHDGWVTDAAFSGTSERGDELRNEFGFELSLFLELIDVLFGLWKPDVILRPLTNRFLRGALQLVARVVSFVDDSMDDRIKFGAAPNEMPKSASIENGQTNGSLHDVLHESEDEHMNSLPSRRLYCWGESEETVAAVAWELTILETSIRHDYVNAICRALASSEDAKSLELRSLVSEVLNQASDHILPLVDKAWNETIVKMLLKKCSSPLSAVKGVAATYRMTNRPPPSHASPFVSTILRPLAEFDREFANRTPERIGTQWKLQVAVPVSDRYASAVEELLATVARTEVALKNRRVTKKSAAGGMSDGEKVKLQLYLDYQAFAETVRSVGLSPETIQGVSKLRELTAEGKALAENTNGDKL